MHVDTATTLAFLLGVIIPHATSLISNNRIIPAWAGGYVTLFLAGATGFCAEWAQAIADNTGYSWVQGLARALVTFAIAALSRLVVHRDTPLDTTLLDKGAPRAMRRGGKPAPGPGPYAPEHADDAGEVGLALVLLVLLIVVLFGTGFLFHPLWWLIIIVVVILLYLAFRDRRVP